MNHIVLKVTIVALAVSVIVQSIAILNLGASDDPSTTWQPILYGTLSILVCLLAGAAIAGAIRLRMRQRA
jgi:hypothetical protein